MSDLICVNESRKAADLAETESSGSDASNPSISSTGVVESPRNSEIRLYEAESLGTIAVKIVENVNKADDHVIEAAMLVREARKRVNEGKAGQLVTWSEWATKHIDLGESRLRELQRIADADDPKAELERIRAGNRERAAKHRAKQKEQISNSDSQNRRDVTSVENDGHNSVSEKEISSEAEPQPTPGRTESDEQPKRTTAQGRARFVDIGESVITKSPEIASFEKLPETPSEAGLVVLVAYVNINGSTDVKGFVTDKQVVDLALSVVGKMNEAEASDIDESSVSERRTTTVYNAVEGARTEGRSCDQEAA